MRLVAVVAVVASGRLSDAERAYSASSSTCDDVAVSARSALMTATAGCRTGRQK